MFRVKYLIFKRLSWVNKKIFVILHRFKLNRYFHACILVKGCINGGAKCRPECFRLLPNEKKMRKKIIIIN